MGVTGTDVGLHVFNSAGVLFVGWILCRHPGWSWVGLVAGFLSGIYAGVFMATALLGRNYRRPIQ